MQKQCCRSVQIQVCLLSLLLAFYSAQARADDYLYILSDSNVYILAEASEDRQLIIKSFRLHASVSRNTHCDEEKDEALRDNLQPMLDEIGGYCVGKNECDTVCDEEADVQLLGPHLQRRHPFVPSMECMLLTLSMPSVCAVSFQPSSVSSHMTRTSIY